MATSSESDTAFPNVSPASRSLPISLMVSVHALTPGEVRARGAGLEIAHGMHATPYGRAFIAVTARGILSLAFVDGEDDEEEGEGDALDAEGPQRVFRVDQCVEAVEPGGVE